MASNGATRGTVLVVDDEPGVRALARRILEGGGYHVLEAGHGGEAIEIMSGSTPIDFLIADLDMPVMRGEEMADQDPHAAARHARALRDRAQRAAVQGTPGTARRRSVPRQAVHDAGTA